MTTLKFYEKYAWIIFLLFGIVFLVGGFPHALGINTDPALVQTISGYTIEEIKNYNPGLFNLYNFYFTGGGLSDIGLAFFIIVISITAYKQGQKWAWYAFLFIPVYFLSWIFISFDLPQESKASLFSPLIVIIVLSCLGQILSFRSFFMK